MRNILFYCLYLLIVWGGVRYFFRLPEAIEELWIKPVIWLTPIFIWNSFLKSRVRFWAGDMKKSVSWGLALGIFYWLITGGYKTVNLVGLDLVAIAFSTAVVEELVFSGFILSLLTKLGYSANLSLLLTGVLVVVERLPIMLFVYDTSLLTMIVSLVFVFSYAVINGFVYLRTGNLAGSVVARWALNLSLLFN